METKLLTYEELGTALGITPASAKRLALRRKWMKRAGNDGKTRVSVPVERLVVPAPAVAGDDASDVTSDDASDVTGDVTSDTGDKRIVDVLERHIARLEGEIASLKADHVAETAALKTDRDFERARADDLMREAAAVASLRVTLEALRSALQTERDRSAELRVTRDRLISHLNEPPPTLLQRLRRALVG